VSPRKETAGPSTTLRSGRDDNSIAGQVFLGETLASITELSSRPERSVVEGPAVSFRGLHSFTHTNWKKFPRNPLFHSPDSGRVPLDSHQPTWVKKAGAKPHQRSVFFSFPRQQCSGAPSFALFAKGGIRKSHPSTSRDSRHYGKQLPYMQNPDLSSIATISALSAPNLEPASSRSSARTGY
jgi:hypothetical protein